MGLGWYKLVVGADYVLGVAVDVIVGFFVGVSYQAAGGGSKWYTSHPPPSGAACNGEQTQQNPEQLGKTQHKNLFQCLENSILCLESH